MKKFFEIAYNNRLGIDNIRANMFCIGIFILGLVSLDTYYGLGVLIFGLLLGIVQQLFFYYLGQVEFLYEHTEYDLKDIKLLRKNKRELFNKLFEKTYEDYIKNKKNEEAQIIEEKEKLYKKVEEEIK